MSNVLMRSRPAIYLISALICGLLLSWGVYNPTVTSVIGVVQARSESVRAGQSGTVASLLVKPGSLVAPGTPLLTLDNTPLLDEIRTLEGEISTLRRELEQASARGEIETADRRHQLEMDAFETRLKLAEYQQRRWRSELTNLLDSEEPGIAQVGFSAPEGLPRLFGSEIISGPTSSDLQMELCQERLNEIDRLLSQLNSFTDRAHGVDLVKERLLKAEEELKIAKSRDQKFTILAPSYGIVGVFEFVPGERVDPDSTLVEIFDEEDPFLVAMVPSSLITSYVPGTSVTIQFPGNKTRTGRVDEIPPQVSRSEFGEGKTRFVAVTIAPIGKLWPDLPFGSEVKISTNPE